MFKSVVPNFLTCISTTQRACWKIAGTHPQSFWFRSGVGPQMWIFLVNFQWMLHCWFRDYTLRSTTLSQHWIHHFLAKNYNYYVNCSSIHGLWTICLRIVCTVFKSSKFLFPTQDLLNQTPSEGWRLGIWIFSKFFSVILMHYKIWELLISLKC